MYNNPYINTYNPQTTKDRIDSQIAQLQQMKEQLNQPINQPTNLTQNFQLAPSGASGMKFVETIDDVNRELVFNDTPFFSKDMSVVWIKNAKGEIKTYELNEIIAKDDKDIQIEMLQAQINEMKGMIRNAKSNDEYVDEPVENEKPSNVPVHRTSTKKSK